MLRTSVIAVLPIAAAAAWPGSSAADCGCSGNPGTITSDATGFCLKYRAPSGPANDITYRFERAYACGRYATGEYFVVAAGGGPVRINAITPVAAGFHGVDVNPR